MSESKTNNNINGEQNNVNGDQNNLNGEQNNLNKIKNVSHYLSVREPFAALLVANIKKVEHRSYKLDDQHWNTAYLINIL